MSCLETKFQISPVLDGKATVLRDFSCRFAFVCPTALGEDVLWASDCMVLTVDGGRIYLRKN